MTFQAVVLAGGKGTRLQPFTHILPKPLLPVEQRPILDIVLTQLARQGCSKATLAIGHLGHLIEIYCDGAQRWSLEIEYFRESSPLGTVGALAQIESLPATPFIVMNGDVLSDVSFPALLKSHVDSGAELTIASFSRTTRDELGIIDADWSGRLLAYHEKPEHRYLVSMGIYVFEPSAVKLIPRDAAMDLPNLVQALLERGRHVHAYAHDGYWLDLGRPDDFALANQDFDAIRPRLGIDV